MKTNLRLLIFLVHQCLIFQFGVSDPDVGVGYKVTLDIPPAFTVGFVGRAFLMETGRGQQAAGPDFRTAISVEAMDGDEEYSCSLDIFLGNVRVWSSGHFNRFRTADKCSIQLTAEGDLQLVGQNGRVGWRSGTSGQGVQRLHLLRSGNLVLVDSSNSIKWQTFNFPTDVMLWGQRLSSRTRLTSFVTPTLFYTFEVQYGKIALFLNSGKLKYSYWEFRPPVGEHNITYVELTSDSLELYNGAFQKVAEISSSSQNQASEEPVRFLSLENATGNLALYYYSSEKSTFQPSYKALNTTCDHPLACDPYGICTFSQGCSCISLVTGYGGGGGSRSSGCSSSNVSGGAGGCGEEAVMMVEVKGVTSVLRGVEVVDQANVSKDRCESLCLNNCTCAAAMYSTESERGEFSCFLYDYVRGIKQVDDDGSRGNRYMIKVPKQVKEGRVRDRDSGLKPWAAILIGVGDGLLIMIVVGGIAYYFIRKRRNSFEDTGQQGQSS